MKKAQQLYTTTDIARRYGVTTRCITARAQARGMTPYRRVGSGYLWTAKQARDLAPRAVGWPGHAGTRRRVS